MGNIADSSVAKQIQGMQPTNKIHFAILMPHLFALYLRIMRCIGAVIVALFLTCLVLCAEIPTPSLVTFYDPQEEVFGMWWISDGSSFDYILEVNELDGFGWFTIATWVAPPRGTIMSGYTYITWGNKAIGRERVRATQPAPTPRDLVNWRVMSPVRF